MNATVPWLELFRYLTRVYGLSPAAIGALTLAQAHAYLVDVDPIRGVALLSRRAAAAVRERRAARRTVWIEGQLASNAQRAPSDRRRARLRAMAESWIAVLECHNGLNPTFAPIGGDRVHAEYKTRLAATRPLRDQSWVDQLRGHTEALARIEAHLARQRSEREKQDKPPRLVREWEQP